MLEQNVNTTRTDKCFMMVRSNPKLTGNIKFVYDIDSDKLYLDSRNIGTLTDARYKMKEVNTKSELCNDLSYYLSGVDSESLYKTISNFDNTEDITLLDSKYTIEDEYINGCYSTTRLPNDKCKARLRLETTLYCPKNFPKIFVIYKYKTTDIDKNIKSVVDAKTSKCKTFEDIKSKYEIYKIIRLDDKGMFSYFNRYFNELNQKTPYPIYFNADKTINYFGINWKYGLVTEQPELSSIMYRQSVSAMDFDNYVMDGFKRQDLLFPYMVNIDFVFNYDDNDKCYNEINQYFGMFGDYSTIVDEENDVVKLLQNECFYKESEYSLKSGSKLYINNVIKSEDIFDDYVKTTEQNEDEEETEVKVDNYCYALKTTKGEIKFTNPIIKNGIYYLSPINGDNEYTRYDLYGVDKINSNNNFVVLNNSPRVAEYKKISFIIKKKFEADDNFKLSVYGEGKATPLSEITIMYKNPNDVVYKDKDNNVYYNPTTTEIYSNNLERVSVVNKGVNIINELPESVEATLDVLVSKIKKSMAIFMDVNYADIKYQGSTAYVVTLTLKNKTLRLGDLSNAKISFSPFVEVVGQPERVDKKKTIGVYTEFPEYWFNDNNNIGYYYIDYTKDIDFADMYATILNKYINCIDKYDGLNENTTSYKPTDSNKYDKLDNIYFDMDTYDGRLCVAVKNSKYGIEMETSSYLQLYSLFELYIYKINLFEHRDFVSYYNYKDDDGTYIYRDNSFLSRKSDKTTKCSSDKYLDKINDCSINTCSWVSEGFNAIKNRYCMNFVDTYGVNNSIPVYWTNDFNPKEPSYAYNYSDYFNARSVMSINSKVRNLILNLDTEGKSNTFKTLATFFDAMKTIFETTNEDLLNKSTYSTLKYVLYENGQYHYNTIYNGIKYEFTASTNTYNNYHFNIVSIPYFVGVLATDSFSTPESDANSEFKIYVNRVANIVTIAVYIPIVIPSISGVQLTGAYNYNNDEKDENGKFAERFKYDYDYYQRNMFDISYGSKEEYSKYFPKIGDNPDTIAKLKSGEYRLNTPALAKIVECDLEYKKADWNNPESSKLTWIRLVLNCDNHFFNDYIKEIKQNKNVDVQFNLVQGSYKIYLVLGVLGNNQEFDFAELGDDQGNYEILLGYSGTINSDVYNLDVNVGSEITMLLSIGEIDDISMLDKIADNVIWGNRTSFVKYNAFSFVHELAEKTRSEYEDNTSEYGLYIDYVKPTSYPIYTTLYNNLSTRETTTVVYDEETDSYVEETEKVNTYSYDVPNILSYKDNINIIRYSDYATIATQALYSVEQDKNNYSTIYDMYENPILRNTTTPISLHKLYNKFGDTISRCDNINLYFTDMNEYNMLFKEEENKITVLKPFNKEYLLSKNIRLADKIRFNLSDKSVLKSVRSVIEYSDNILNKYTIEEGYTSVKTGKTTTVYCFLEKLLKDYLFDKMKDILVNVMFRKNLMNVYEKFQDLKNTDDTINYIKYDDIDDELTKQLIRNEIMMFIEKSEYINAYNITGCTLKYYVRADSSTKNNITKFDAYDYVENDYDYIYTTHEVAKKYEQIDINNKFNIYFEVPAVTTYNAINFDIEVEYGLQL